MGHLLGVMQDAARIVPAATATEPCERSLGRSRRGRKESTGQQYPSLVRVHLWKRAKGGRVPRKVRDLMRDLKEAGFVDRGGKGSHRNFVHHKVRKPVTLCGHQGDDALHYQEQAVRLAIEESRR